MLPDHLPELARQRPRINHRSRRSGLLGRSLSLTFAAGPSWPATGLLRLIKDRLCPRLSASASPPPPPPAPPSSGSRNIILSFSSFIIALVVVALSSGQESSLTRSCFRGRAFTSL